MNISPVLIAVYLIGLFLLCVLCWVFIKPIKWMLRLIFSCCIGLIAMSAINYIFAGSGTIFYMNPLTAMISGVLGIPGMIMGYILQLIL